MPNWSIASFVEIAKLNTELRKSLTAQLGAFFKSKQLWLFRGSEYDDLPEAAFSMVGSIEQAIEKAKTL